MGMMELKDLCTNRRGHDIWPTRCPHIDYGSCWLLGLSCFRSGFGMIGVLLANSEPGETATHGANGNCIGPSLTGHIRIIG